MAELPQEQRDLPAMQRGVIEDVLDEFSQRVDIVIHGSRRIQFRLRQAIQIVHVLVVMAGPSGAKARKIGIFARDGLRQEAVMLPEVEPSALAPENMDQCALDLSEACAEVAVEFFDREGRCSLEEAVVCPTVKGC